jgi:hypothetical protein
MASLMAHVCNARPRVHFLVLTPEHKFALNRLEEAGLNSLRYTVTCVEHSKVAGYLNAADVGLLLRESTFTNRVASPTKFGEYMACGLLPFVSPNIGDLDQLAEQSGLWPLLRGDDTDKDVLLSVIDDADLLGEAARRTRAEWAGRNWTMQSGGEALVDLYRKVLALHSTGTREVQ